MNNRINLVMFLFSLLLVSCTMEPTISDQMAMGEEETVGDIRKLMDASYASMANVSYLGRDYIIAGEVRADNVYANGNSNRLTAMSQLRYTSLSYGSMFGRIYIAIRYPDIILGNVDLENLEGSKDDLNHIIGEAYGARAMLHFDLLRNYGQQYIDEGENLGISYVKEFKKEQKPQPARGTVEENKKDLYQDLDQAIEYLKKGANSQYATDRTRLTLDAVYILKTRIATYFKEYDKVREAAQEIYGKHQVIKKDDYVDFWDDLSPRAIFELEYDVKTALGSDGIGVIYRNIEKYGDIQCFDDLIEDAQFDSGDVRASSDMIAWQGNRLYNIGKYPHNTGDFTSQDNIKVFRYEELILNYAEALVDTDNDKARNLLNEIAEERGAKLYSGKVDMDDVLAERRKELLFEGFRFYDLVRHQKTIRQLEEKVQNPHGEIEPGSYRLAMPIPDEEINSNRETKQNPNY